MINVIKWVCGIAFAILILNESLSIIEKHSGCKESRRRALYSLLPGKPCADFETRVQLDGEFLNCKEAEKVAASSTYRCAMTNWLGDWLPTRVMALVSEHPIIYFVSAMLTVLLFYYITALAFVADRANARKYNSSYGNQIYLRNDRDNRMITAPARDGRITYVDEDYEPNYYQRGNQENQMYNRGYYD